MLARRRREAQLAALEEFRQLRRIATDSGGQFKLVLTTDLMK